MKLTKQNYLHQRYLKTNDMELLQKFLLNIMQMIPNAFSHVYIYISFAPHAECAYHPNISIEMCIKRKTTSTVYYTKTKNLNKNPSNGIGHNHKSHIMNIYSNSMRPHAMQSI